MFLYNFFSSFWGKFGEHQNKPQAHAIQTAHQLFGLLHDPAYINEFYISDSSSEVTSNQPRKDCRLIPLNPNSNAFKN